MEPIKLTLSAPATGTLMPRVHRGKPVRATDITFGPVRVVRHNKIEARAEITRQLQSWLENWQRPTTLRFKDSVAILSPLPSEEPGKVAASEMYVGFDATGFYVRESTSAYDSWTAAKRHAWYRLVDAWVDFFDDDQIDEACRALATYDRSGEDERALRRYAGFQRAYRAAEAAGESDPHRWAGNHENEYTPRPRSLTS